MFRNYLTIAWRNLTKNKLYSFINIGGLSVGLSMCMLIMLYVAHEMSFDQFHKKANHIFYPVMNIQAGDRNLSVDRMSFETGPMLKKADPEVESFLRIREFNERKVVENLSDPEKKFTQQNVILADSNYFEFFSFRLLEGNKSSVLTRPFTAVISEQLAMKFFGEPRPIGKLLRFDDKYNFEITGIVENTPSNSSLNYEFIASMSSIMGMDGENKDLFNGKVDAGSFRTFLLLQNTDKKIATSNILQRLSGNGDSKFEKFNFTLNSLVNRHRDYNMEASVKYGTLFSWVAGLILFLALVNYMSLATARATVRAKEVGVRKVMGADRGNFVKQFYTESSLYAVIAFLLAAFLFVILRPAFYHFLQLNVDENFVRSSYALAIFAGLFILTIIISGSYPSFVLSGFNPVSVLYGKLSTQKGGAIIRKFFTVLQFSIAVALIISSIMIYRQMDFLRHMDTGMNRERVVMIPFQKNISEHYLAFKRSVENTKGVQSVSMAAAPLFGGIDMSTANYGNSGDNPFVSQMYIDNNFLRMLDMKWKIAPVDEQQITAKNHIVVNESMARRMRLPVNPIGEQLIVGRDTVTVAGVLKDFNFSSLHYKIEPLCLTVLHDTNPIWYADNGDCLFVKISPNTNIPTLLGDIKNIYDKMDKQTPFEYHFVDDAFDAQYRAENNMAKIFAVFTAITIFIACLGLFGLAAFSASQRRKEIGIRKVLGADVSGIITTIGVSFIKPVIVSIIIAIPLAWMFAHQWLQDFAFHTNVSGWVFILSGLVVLFIAAATVSFHAIRAAVANPVESLRTE
ncbi:ABC transporter permease [Pollutibacter soli]|uniref:ABC transporter permease n=1 Tax=Pollutibacter soli TaxID=3034157 RepID=UPI003013269F